MVHLDFEKYALPNGLEVILREDHRLPLAAVNIWYHVGAINESPGLTGFAHLFEHMMFQGSGHLGESSHFERLEGAGASFVNGTTDFDRTNYMEDVPSNQLELALWLESDRMGYLLDRLDQGSLSNQQDVVRNERRESTENAPYGLVEEALWHLLFPREHPYHSVVIGSHEDIQAARLEDVRAFFRRYYAPNNATLVIAGDIDPPRTKALVEKYFGTLPRGEAPPPVQVDTPPVTSERRKVVSDQVELPRVYVAWHSPSIFTPGDAEADLAARILGGGKASRLYEALVYDRKIAQTVSAHQQSLTLTSVFLIEATAKPGHTADELERTIDAELERLAAEGPTADELNGGRNAIVSRMVRSLESLGGMQGVANRLNFYNHFTGDPGYLQRDLDRYAAVTREGVRAFVKEALAPSKRAVVHGVPGVKEVPAGPPTPAPVARATSWPESAESWRAEVPKAGPVSTAPLPSAKRFTLANGLTVFLTESHALPVVAAYLVVRSGSAVDPADRPGLSGFTSAMLDEGAGKRDALAIARELEGLGATLTPSSNADGSSLSGRALRKDAGALLALMSDVALRPTFPPAEVERVRNDLLTAIVQQRDSPFQVAVRALATSLYGEEHPYGHITLGDEASLRAITRDELVGFWMRHYTPANAALVLAGDLTESDARVLAEEAFGSWEGDAARAPEIPAGAPIAERVIVVDKPAAPQTAVLVGQPAVRRSDPDYETLRLMNDVLGGLFSSRLNMNLREDKGYTYGAFSILQERRGVGGLMLGATVRSDASGASVAETLGEVRRMLAAPMTPEELRLAKDSYIRSLPALFETSGSTVNTIGVLYMLDQPPGYYESLPARVESLTLEQVFDATRRHLDPERMRIVAVGDRKAVLPQLESLELGTIVEMSPDGKRVETSR
jgi:zinc protease